MLLWHLLLKTRLKTFQALNIWIIIEINVIRGDRWDLDEQFSNCGGGAPVICGTLCLCTLAHLQWSYQISAESKTCMYNASCEAESIQLDFWKPADLVELAAINIFI